RVGRIGADAEFLDPGDLGIEPDHLVEDVDDAGEENAEDDAVHRGIAEEILQKRASQQRRPGGHGEHEDHHAEKISARTCHHGVGPVRSRVTGVYCVTTRRSTSSATGPSPGWLPSARTSMRRLRTPLPMR